MNFSSETLSGRTRCRRRRRLHCCNLRHHSRLCVNENEQGRPQTPPTLHCWCQIYSLPHVYVLYIPLFHLLFFPDILLKFNFIRQNLASLAMSWNRNTTKMHCVLRADKYSGYEMGRAPHTWVIRHYNLYSCSLLLVMLNTWVPFHLLYSIRIFAFKLIFVSCRFFLVLSIVSISFFESLALASTGLPCTLFACSQICWHVKCFENTKHFPTEAAKLIFPLYALHLEIYNSTVDNFRIFNFKSQRK